MATNSPRQDTSLRPHTNKRPSTVHPTTLHSPIPLNHTLHTHPRTHPFTSQSHPPHSVKWIFVLWCSPNIPLRECDYIDWRHNMLDVSFELRSVNPQPWRFTNNSFGLPHAQSFSVCLSSWVYIVCICFLLYLSVYLCFARCACCVLLHIHFTFFNFKTWTYINVVVHIHCLYDSVCSINIIKKTIHVCIGRISISELDPQSCCFIQFCFVFLCMCACMYPCVAFFSIAKLTGSPRSQGLNHVTLVLWWILERCFATHMIMMRQYFRV